MYEKAEHYIKYGIWNCLLISPNSSIITLIHTYSKWTNNFAEAEWIADKKLKKTSSFQLDFLSIFSPCTGKKKSAIDSRMSHPYETLESFVFGQQLLVQFDSLQMVATEISVSLQQVLCPLAGELAQNCTNEKDAKNYFYAKVRKMISTHNNIT